MKVCLFSWNPSDSLSFASPCLSPLLLVYLFTEACEKRGATGNFLRGWCWQMVRASSVLNSALWIPEFFSVLETEQLQPLNKTCFPYCINSLGWQAPLLLNLLVFAAAKAAFDVKAKGGALPAEQGGYVPHKDMLVSLQRHDGFGSFLHIYQMMANTRVALAEEQTHPSLCVFDLWLPF